MRGGILVLVAEGTSKGFHREREKGYIEWEREEEGERREGGRSSLLKVC